MNDRIPAISETAPSPLFLYLFKLWQKHRLAFILTPLLSMIAMTIYALFGMKIWYKATVNAFPATTEGTSFSGLLSGISSALPDIGLTQLGQAEGGFSPLVILQSRRMLDTLIDLYNLAQLYDLPDSPRARLREYVAANIDVSFEREGNYLISVYHTDPKTAANMANHMVELANTFASELAQRQYRWQIEFLEKRLQSINASLQKAKDSLIQFAHRFQIIEPETQVQAAIESIAELRAQLMKSQIELQMLKQAYGENDPAVRAQQKIIESLQSQIQEMETQPGFFGKFALQKGAAVAIQYLELLTNVETYYKIKTLLIPMLEETQVKAQRFNRVLTVLDPAVPPDMKAKPKRSLYVFGAGIASFLFLLIGLILWERYQFYKRNLQYTHPD